MEANTNQTEWFIPCCFDEDCHLCKGTGKIYPERCPVHYYKGDIKTLRYLYDCYTHKNILPFSGSPINQPKVLFKHFDMINYYLSVFRDVKNRGEKETNEMVDYINSGKR